MCNVFVRRSANDTSNPNNIVETIDVDGEDGEYENIQLQALENQEKEFTFPVKAVNVCKYYCCLACNKDFEESSIVGSSDEAIKCPLCGMCARCDTMQWYFSAKLSFDEGEVNVYRHQLKLFYDRKKLSLPKTEKEVTLDILQDEKSVLITNNRGTCVGFKN